MTHSWNPQAGVLANLCQPAQWEKRSCLSVLPEAEPQGLRTPTLPAPPSSSKSEHTDILSAHWLKILTVPHKTQGSHFQMFSSLFTSPRLLRRSLESVQAHPVISVLQMKKTNKTKQKQEHLKEAQPLDRDHTAKVESKLQIFELQSSEIAHGPWVLVSGHRDLRPLGQRQTQLTWLLYS